MTFRSSLSLIAASAIIAAGCGGDGESDAEGRATPEQAIAEIGEVRKSLEAALRAYEAGDAAEADQQVGDAYLEHFELVEGPLDEVDHALTEELEDGIREELRGKIRDKAPEAEVKALHDEIEASLAKAEAALR